MELYVLLKPQCWENCMLAYLYIWSREFLGKLVFTLTSCHSSSWSPTEASNKPTEVIIIDI